MTGIEVLDKYTNFYAGQFNRDGLDIDKDEIAGELGEAYAAALDGYDETRDVKFTTYVISAFKNRMKLLKKSYMGRPSMVPLDEHSHLAPNSEHTAEDWVIIEDLKTKIMRRLRGRELIVFREMIDPSDKVCEAIDDIMEMQKGEPHQKFIAKGGGVLRLAISLVYGYDRHSIRYQIEKIRKKAEKVLDFSMVNK